MGAATTSEGLGTGGTYRALEQRNRMVTALRVLVPLIGLMVLAALFVQMIVAGMEREFSIGRISFERNRMVVDTPSYTGMLADGSAYDMTAGSAETALDRPSVIELSQAHATLRRSSGVRVTADAEQAEVETQLQQIDIPGPTTIADTTGLKARVSGLHADVPAQLVTGGKVALEYADDATLAAEAMRYDVRAQTWTFTDVTVTLPDLPGAEEDQ